ncbi:bifunctional DNA primase/polymerase [Actinocorallia libanotica]|uniref:Bifunctional DNA primase/polymerase n=1 Tax=Actinocorallia libanotica TaxID=46162 RepID=A0ABN1S017_9ACTN
MPSHRPDQAVRLALELAELGWHILPLSPTSKRPLANCPDCRDTTTHAIERCVCIPAGRLCHGVRAATIDPNRITRWWNEHPDAIPGIAAGPSHLVLIDLDTHADQPPADPAAELLPGIDLAAKNIPAEQLADIRSGRDVLLLLAKLRGGPRPWPTGPEHQAVVVTTPSGGRHLWYRAPPGIDLRQAIGELGWQIDIKAGWSYGIAPSALTRRGPYTVLAGDPARPGRMPAWLEHEVRRAASRRALPKGLPKPLPTQVRPSGQAGPSAYLTTVIERGAAELTRLHDGRQRALSALAYKAGGLLAWSGLPRSDVETRLIDIGTASGLPDRLARRVVTRAIANGVARPLPEPGRKA